MASGADLDGVLFDPVAARNAAARLDGLAARLEIDLSEGEPALTVPPAGADEVSLRASQTMNGVAESYAHSAEAGIAELKKLAATLRSQATQFGRAESVSVADFGAEGMA